MARRRMTLRRIDPWSVLKFGLVLNLCLLAIALLGAAIVWWVVNRLGLIEQACDLATEVGFEQCGVNGGNLFRWLLVLGILGVIVQTALYVFGAFLHNLIADLVGGIGATLVEEGGSVASTGATGVRQTAGATAGTAAVSTQRPRRSETAPTEPRHERPTGDTVAAPPVDAGTAREAANAQVSERAGSGAPVGGDSSGSEEGGPWPWERDRPTEAPERRSDERLFGE